MDFSEETVIKTLLNENAHGLFHRTSVHVASMREYGGAPFNNSDNFLKPNVYGDSISWYIEARHRH